MIRQQSLVAIHPTAVPRVACWIAVVLAFGGRLPAANITSIVTNAAGQSWSTPGTWSNNAAPTAGNDYFITSGFGVRTPEASGAFTFPGDSLTIESGGILILKNRSPIVVTLTATGGSLSHFSTGDPANRAVIQGTISLDATLIANTGSDTARIIDIEAPVSGAGSLDKQGVGLLVLAGSNTFGSGVLSFGGVNVDEGYIQLESDTALGNHTGVSLAGSNAGVSGLNLAGGIRAEYDLTTAGRNNATTAGYILKNVSGSNEWAGSVAVTAGGGGYGIVSDSGTLTISGEISSTFNNASFGARTFDIAGAGNTTISGNIVNGGTVSSQAVGLLKTGGGTLKLSGANTYSNGTTITGGRIVADSDTAFGSAGLTIGTGAAQVEIVAGRSIANAITITGGSGTGTVGQGLVHATGTGTATLGGTVTINGEPASGAHFGSASTATLAITGAVNSASTEVAMRSGTVVLGGGGTYSSFRLSEGVVRLGANNGLSTGAELRFANTSGNDGTLDLAGFNQTLTGLARVGGAVGTNRIGNSSTTSDSTLTTTGTSSFSGIIQDVLDSGTRKVSLVVNGGTLTLTGASTFTGGTSIAAGTLALADGDDRLPVGPLNFTGSARLDVGANAQALTSLATPSGGQFTLAMAGTGGSVSVAGADSLEIGPGGVVAGGQRVTMDMTNLSSFSYSSGSGAFRVGLKEVSSNQSGTVPGASSVRLAESSTITTPLLAVGDRPGTNDGGDAAMTLGQTTLINATNIDQGVFRSNAVMEFAAGLTAPSVTIRGADGTAPITRWRVGMTQTNPGFVRTSFTTVADFSAGSLDASATSIVIGAADSQTQANRGGTQTATFTMGAGTLTAGTLTVGQITGAGSLGGTYAANGTLTIGTSGGLVSAASLQLAENTITAAGSVTKAVSGTVNLSAGTLRAGSIARGAQTGSATSVTTAFNWSGGTIENTPAADLLIDTIPLTLTSGTGTFDATGSNSITVNAGSPISGSGGLVKTGTGRLVLSGTNTYVGATSVNAGTLLINGDSSAAGGAVSVASAATLGGTGTVGGATTIAGIHSPGASPGLQTFVDGLAYEATSTLVWELSANTDLSADRGVLYDGIDVTGGSLDIAAGSVINLVFDAPLVDSTPSAVNWADSFWNSDHTWTAIAFTSSSPATSTGLFTLGTVGPDSLGRSLTSVAGREAASFTVLRSGDDVVVQYVAVPEPGTLAILAAGGLAVWAAARRRHRA